MTRLRVVRDVPGGRPYGLPGPLPAGETLLWQGAPDWHVLARRALHVRKIAVYFAILAIWCAVSAWSGGSPRLWYSTLALLILGTLAVGMLSLFAFLVARTTVYTITDRRVVLRIGISMSMSLNLPFPKIDRADVRINPDGSGDIPVRLEGPTRMGITLLWPHVRPWRLQRVEPMLRAIPDAARVAQILARALAASVGEQAPATAPAMRPQPVRAERPVRVEA